MGLRSFVLGMAVMALALWAKDNRDVKRYVAIGHEHANNLIADIQARLQTPTYFDVTVFRNGRDDGGLTLRVDSVNTKLTDIANVQYPGADVTKIQVFDEDGNRLWSPATFPPNRNVYVLINDETYMMPGVAVGHKRVVNGVTLETLSLLPKAFKIPSFLSEAEADEIVAAASAKMDYTARSTVLEAEGSREVSPTRTSSTTYVLYSEYKHVLRRAWNITNLPQDISYAYPDHQLQVIHYYPDQFFHPHHDGFFASAAGTEEWFYGGKRNRFITIFIYLNDVEDGGETAFIRWSDYASFNVETYHITDKNPCDTAVVRVKPKKGDAILFYNLKVGEHMDGIIEMESLHTGCGVKKGEKWACNVWLYNKPMDTEESRRTMTHSELLPDWL